MDLCVEWLDLPKELWPMIAKRINSTIDVIRFRSVCKLWRSLLPLHSSHHTLFAPHISFPRHNFPLFQTKTYRLQHPSSSQGWIIKVGESTSAQLRLLDPFTNLPVSKAHQRSPSETSSKVLNLMNFRVVELIQAYAPNPVSLTERFLAGRVGEDGGYFYVVNISKVVLFPSFHVDDRMVFVLYKDGRLGVFKIGDENLTIMDDEKTHYDDIIVHKGQLYVVDNCGTISWIDCSSLKLVQFSPVLCGLGKKKQLVGCDGSLYVVDMYVEGEPNNTMGTYYEVVDIKVYKLDEEWGRWLDVKNLGDVLFVLGKDANFSLSAQGYYGCEGNCIYFSSEDRVCAFNLENSRFKSPNPFWACSTLFHPMFNLQV